MPAAGRELRVGIDLGGTKIEGVVIDANHLRACVRGRHVAARTGR
jgi:predicted NBD/HSP70 family sugar kinase